MYKFLPRFLLVILFLCLNWLPRHAQAQGSRVEFGKNVVQYKEFDWFYYDNPLFKVYYYQAGQELARFIVANGEEYLREVERKIDFPVGEKITYIVYHSYNDFQQSNYRIKNDPYRLNTYSRVAGDKVFLYFTGNHFELEQQIKAGILQIALNEMLYGGSIQERVQSSVLLNVPDWYLQGLILYLSGGWTPEMQAKVRAGVASERFSNFNRLTEEERVYIAAALWKEIDQRYKELPNMLYIMRSSKSVESSFQFVLGKSFDGFYKQWLEQYKGQLPPEDQLLPKGQPIEVKRLFKKGEVIRWSMSARQDYLAVTTHFEGITELWLVDLKNNRRRRLMKLGYRRLDVAYDRNYPVFKWHPSLNELVIFYEDKSQLFYYSYNADQKKPVDDPRLITRVEQIIGFDIAEDGRTTAISAISRGFTDIYIFDLRSFGVRQLTADVYDDIEPHFVPGTKRLLFSSNRPNTGTERKKVNERDYQLASSFDAFVFLDYQDNQTLKRLSNSPWNERRPSAYDTTHYSYLTDATGVVNRDAVRYDSAFSHIRVTVLSKDTAVRQNDTLYFLQNDPSVITFNPGYLTDSLTLRIDTAFVYRDTFYNYPITDYPISILSYDLKPRQGSAYELFYANGKYALIKTRLPQDILSQSLTQPRVPLNTPANPKSALPSATPATQSPATADSMVSATYPYFQTPFPVPEQPEETSPSGANGNPSVFTQPEDGVNESLQRIRNSRSSPYFPAFSKDVSYTALDNSLINSPYIPYNGQAGPVYNPALSGMFVLGISDLFKDYIIKGGTRIQPNLRGAEYFIQFENLRKRLDKSLFFFRRGLTDQNENGYYRQTSYELRGGFTWPFSETFSVHLGSFGRVDNQRYLVTDKRTLELPTSRSMWLGLRNVWTIDNSIRRSLNMWNGTQARFYTELFGAPTDAKTFFVVTGFDARRSFQLLRGVTWANRVAGASSFGKARIVYFLGGVDNWLLPKYDEMVLVDPEQNYVYKTLATPMRGYMQNVRNGNSYLLANTELRISPFKLLFRRPFTSNFIDNLQFIGFFDAGSAWTGINPFSSDNAVSKRIIEQTPFRITVTTPRDPFVYGYGFGFRTLLLGYFLRVDYAWGLQDGEALSKMVHVSLGIDF